MTPAPDFRFRINWTREAERDLKQEAAGNDRVRGEILERVSELEDPHVAQHQRREGDGLFAYWVQVQKRRRLRVYYTFEPDQTILIKALDEKKSQSNTKKRQRKLDTRRK